MPELPDILAYIAALRREFVGGELQRIEIRSPFLLRSVEPTVVDICPQRVTSIERLGKRLVHQRRGPFGEDAVNGLPVGCSYPGKQKERNK